MLFVFNGEFTALEWTSGGFDPKKIYTNARPQKHVFVAWLFYLGHHAYFPSIAIIISIKSVWKLV